jgi:hypothetical protein
LFGEGEKEILSPPFAEIEDFGSQKFLGCRGLFTKSPRLPFY